MKLLCNENIPLASVLELRSAGYDVVSISEDCPGVSDFQVIKIAADDSRILVTFDGDYGELIYIKNLPCPPAVLYLRFCPADPLEPAAFLKSVLAKGKIFLEGYFLVIEPESIRRRPLPLLASVASE